MSDADDRILLQPSTLWGWTGPEDESGGLDEEEVDAPTELDAGTGGRCHIWPRKTFELTRHLAQKDLRTDEAAMK